MLLEFNQAADADPPYQMHGLIGWDEESKHYIFHWFDSLGGAASNIAGKLAVEQLILEGPDPVRGGYTRFTWSFAGDKHAISIECSKDQESWELGMKEEYQRTD